LCRGNESPAPSPNDEEKGEEEGEEGEGGAHDTITSLAGAKMLQKYRKQIRGHHVPAPLRRASQDGASSARLEHLFKVNITRYRNVSFVLIL
jgi:hypothetical protein